MKKIYFILAGFILFSAINIAYYQSASQSFVRFHITAESNSPYDQLVKIKLRDCILSAISEDLSSFKTKEQTLEYLFKNKDMIKKTADDYLKSINYNNETSVTLKKEYFPHKKYTGFSLPYGKYDALRITIGKGKGKNFFCVLFPAVCISTEMTGEVNKILGNKKIVYKFKLFDKEIKL